MAWSSIDVPVAERNLLAADLPLVLGSNVLRPLALTLGMRWTSTGGATDTDITAATAPAALAADDQDHAQTRPSTAGTRYFQMSWGVSLPAGDFDSMVLKNHNLAGLAISVQIADSADFLTNPATIYSATPSTNKRIVALTLKQAGDTYAQRYSNVAWARLTVVGGGVTPRVGEIVLSRRRQLASRLMVPVDVNRRRRVAAEFVSYSQVITSYVYAYGQREFIGAMHVNDAATIAALTSMWTDTVDGSRPWFWVENPSTLPSDALWLRSRMDALISPTSFGTDRMFEFDAIEAGPNFLAAGL